MAVSVGPFIAKQGQMMSGKLLIGLGKRQTVLQGIDDDAVGRTSGIQRINWRVFEQQNRFSIGQFHGKRHA